MSWRVLTLLSCAVVVSGCTNDYYGVVIASAADLDRVPANVTWVRPFPGPFLWGDIQTAADLPEDDWSWAVTDQLVEQASAAGKQLVVVLWPYAAWDQLTCHGEAVAVPTLFGDNYQAPYPPCDQAAYEAWLRAVVERYHTQVQFWEIIAQPSLQEPPLAFFIGSAADYEQVFTTSVAVIKQVDPDAQILNGAISGPLSDTITFWGPLFEQGLAESIDIISIQAPVENGTFSMTAFTTWFDRYGIDKPIWITHTTTATTFDSAEKVFYTLEQ